MHTYEINIIRLFSPVRSGNFSHQNIVSRPRFFFAREKNHSYSRDYKYHPQPVRHILCQVLI